jgi:hypothetical protein
MGYTTDFSGQLSLSRPATQKEIDYINLLCSTRRMKRDVEKLKELYKGEHGLDGDYGVEGEFFAKDDGEYGQKNDGTVIDYNSSGVQPGLWCQWLLTEDGERLEWDGGEKFYHYVEWLRYLIEKFFHKWDILLNGEIKWQGEDMDDRGKIIVKDNVVETIKLE